MNTKSNQTSTATTEGSNPEVLTKEYAKRVFDKLRSKWVTIAILEVLNDVSLKEGYNNCLNWSRFREILEEQINSRDYDRSAEIGINYRRKKNFEWRGTHTLIRLKPRMPHYHKYGKECEPHIRCEISSPFANFRNLVIDVRIDLAKLLLSNERTAVIY